MRTFQKYLGLLVAAAMLVGSVGVVTAYRGHHGYYGGRGRGWGWGGGLGIGIGSPYYGYGWPYYGYGWGYPGYYARPSFARDNAGESYWMIYNQSMRPLRVQSDRDETVIPSGAIKKLYRRNSFNIRVYTEGLSRAINTRQHDVAVDLDEAGVPHFKLRE